MIQQYIKNFGGEFVSLYNTLVRDRKNISAFGMGFGERTIFASQLKKCVYVCADYVAAAKAFEQLTAINPKTCLLPPKDDVLVYRKSQGSQNDSARLLTMHKWLNGDCDIIVTSPTALAQLYPKRASFAEYALTLYEKQEYDLSKLSTLLISAGYKRFSQVEAPGQFAIRGDIVDIWTAGSENGIRLEFFGDTLDDIRGFDVFEQTATEKMSYADICPNTDVFYSADEGEKIISVLKKFMPKDTDAQKHYMDMLSDVSIRLNSCDKDVSLGFLMPLFSHVSFMDFFLPEYMVYDDAKSVVDNINIHYTEHENRYKLLLLKGGTIKESIDQFYCRDKIFKTNAIQLAFHKLTSQNRIFDPQAVYNFKTAEIGQYSKRYDDLVYDVCQWMSNGNKVVLFCGTDILKQNLINMFADNSQYKTGGKGEIEFLSHALPYGAVFFEQNLIFIGTSSLSVKNIKKPFAKKRGNFYSEPEVGNYVVHNVHGIGYCEAISRLKIGEAERDYVVISYKNDDKLYVPIENMDTLSKYSESESTPNLSKIGGADFARLKDKVKSSVKAMAMDLVGLYAMRQEQIGHVYSSDNSLLDEFSSDFPFTETDDQLSAIEDGLKDLTEGKIMDRLLCGDVGYGKTEVALRLAFKVILEGKQVAFISPTTILARQHFDTIKRRMEGFGISCASLTRFDSKQSIDNSLQLLANGKIDIVSGTHRVLSNDVKFKDLGLLILDEEQRFGVADKEKIKRLKLNVNVLTLSATPIPRTLHMSMVGIRDISILDTPPSERLPIQTYVTEYSESLVFDAVSREMGRGGQTFIVYNRVETIERFASKLKNILPNAKIAIAHGQMPEKNLENIIADFISGQYDILIASTIIENGIDMPNANTMIVVDSDRFGLSQLYQLRGRIGRSNRIAYVYFTFESDKLLTDSAYKRLDAITQYVDFGSGYKIAMRDLEIRGAGNILGREQHGHIEKVGYDMYCKLLSDAVASLSGKQATEDIKEVKVFTDFDAFIPEGYIKDNAWRVRIYSRISQIKSITERTKLTKDLEDIYGALPSPSQNLILIALVKNLAAAINAASVTIKRGECSINFAKTLDIPKAVISAAGTRLKMLDSKIHFNQDRVGMINFLLSCQK